MLILIADLLLNADTWSTDSVKNVIEAAAVLGTGIYFLFRVLSGFFLVNMAVTVTCVRAYETDTTDWLGASISVKKGDRRAVEIHDVCVIARYPDDIILAMTLTDSFTRWTFRPAPQKASSQNERRFLLANAVSRSKPLLNVAPGEEFVLGSLGSVRRQSPVLVEAAILGKARWSPMWSQWKASCVSLPCYPPMPVVDPKRGHTEMIRISEDA